MSDNLLEILVQLKDEASAQLKQMNAEIKNHEQQWKTSYGAIQKELEDTAKTMGIVGGVITGFFALSVNHAEESMKTERLLAQSIANTGVAYDSVKDKIQGVIDAEIKKTGVSDENQMNALKELVTLTGDYQKALELLPVTLDLAAAKGMDLASAADLIGKAAAGNSTLLVRMFPQLKEIAAAQKEVEDAMKASETAQKDLTKAGEDYASLQDKLLGIQESSVSSQRGLIHAQESAKDAVKSLKTAQDDLVDAQRRVTTAQSALTQMMTTGTATAKDLQSAHDEVTRANKGLQQATDSVELAQRRVRDTGWSLTDAQKAVSDQAKKEQEAQKQVKDAADKLKLAQEGVTQATKDATDAQTKLTAQGDPLAKVTGAVKDQAQAAKQPFDDLKNSISDMEKALGKTVIPTLKNMLDNIVPIVDKIITWIDQNPKLIKGIAELGVGLLVAAAAFKAVAIAMAVVESLAGPEGWATLGLALAAAGAAIIGINKLTETKIPTSGGNAQSTPGNQYGFSGTPPAGYANWDEFLKAVHWQPPQQNQQSPISIPGFASGGIVNSPTLAMIAEAGPEAIVPLSNTSNMGSGQTVIINNYITGSVTTVNDLTQTIRQGLLQLQLKTVNTGFK